jgi:CheY-like chemotaxis protein
MRPLNVLVVEDDLELRMFYQLALMEQGHAVNAVAHGAEALDAVSPAIDLIVTDLGMPIIAGDELIAELRAKPELRDLPVLVITAHPGELRAELRNGRTSVLRKPFELDDFMRWVDAAAAQRVRSN